MVKVIRHGKEFKNVQEEIGHIHRHASDVERNMYSEIHDVRKNFDKYTEDLRRECMAYTDSRTEDLRRECMAYTDSRVDKVQNKKQLLND
jgi:hypothetical protein